MEPSKEKLEEADQMMDKLGNKNQSIMGISQREEGMFDLLLWLLGDGDPPEELEDD